MKKKGITILLVAAMVLIFTTGCNAANADVKTTPVEESPAAFLLLVDEVDTTSTNESLFESAENVELRFRATSSKYKMQGFGEEFSVYRFNSPNEHVVVYQVASCVYVVGSADIESSECYAIIRNPYGEFVALSSNYMLFNTNDGMVAVKINQSQYAMDDRIGEQYSFDNLSDTEKNSFVCPTSCEQVTQ